MGPRFDIALGIGGAAGQGIATPGGILAKLFARRGLHLCAYNAHQSIIRGGHILLTLRVSDRRIHHHGDRLDLLICLNQDTYDRHISLMRPGTQALFNSDAVKASDAPEGVRLIGVPVTEVTGGNRNRLLQNVVLLGAAAALIGSEFEALGPILEQQFARKGEAVVDENAAAARAGFDYALQHGGWRQALPRGPKPLAVWSGNDAIAMGGAAAGVRFYCAYPMSPASGILHWMARNARDLGIMVRQVEDEIAVANMAIGAAHAGCRAMCATSGGGFALMTEAVGAAAMMEIPVVFVNVMRAGPSTGVPTKTEQGDLWQCLGASQGDFERLIAAPRDAVDAFNTMCELFNLVDRCQCPGILISDLQLSEGTFSFDPEEINLQPEIDRGELIQEAGAGNDYLRYRDTESGISPRALPGLAGYVHVVATDEHDEDGVLLSDEFTNPVKRRRMVEKRARKLAGVRKRIPAPELEGPDDAEVTLIGWGSSYGVLKEAVQQLAAKGVRANHLPIRWIVPFHAVEVGEILSRCNRSIIVENNHSGQFHRYLRGETGISVDGHIRKYDGEPFLPHHVVEGVLSQLAGESRHYVPEHEFMV